MATNTYKDHPRACGEKPGGSCMWTQRTGSPPRMRGKGNHLDCWNPSNRITPAHAGKRGTVSVVGGYCKGSPPRMRGKVTIFSDFLKGGRITPAHAGKSGKYPVLLCISQDHPRACGEKLTGRVSIMGIRGSPPRMRGKVCITAIIRTLCRITPAHAGKSPKLRTNSKIIRDHPRACGEKYYYHIAPLYN